VHRDTSKERCDTLERSDWDTLLLRAAFVALLAAIAVSLRPFGLSTLAALATGVCTGITANLLELRVRRATLPGIVGACAGALIGGLLGFLFVAVLNPGPAVSASTSEFLRLTAPLLCGFIGLLVGTAKSELLDLTSIGLFAKAESLPSSLKILDTSVLIDGRIADIAESGFLDGRMILPQFVLHELQLVADSSDSARRNRGRRGLDIVQRLQKMPRVKIEVSSQDFPAVREVDLKLIEFAKATGAKIVTNDFNLNKLAQVQGVDVLNINELANALKPVVLPGEAMRVFILKEGKEYNQGVAYLDDGTMVVVDNARRLISKTVDITVTSVLQTTAGKMIFGKYDDRGEHRSAAASGTSSS
jgi:uncharacterized protein YacL